MSVETVDDAYIQCKLCNKLFHSITPTHVKRHGYTLPQYAKEFGETNSARTIRLKTVCNQESNARHRGIPRSEELKQQVSATLTKYFETHPGPNLGKKLSVVTRAKISLANKNPTVEKRRRMRHSHLRWMETAVGKKFSGTKPELAVIAWLTAQGYVVNQDYQHSRWLFDWLVDFCFEAKKLIVEVDGCYWHNCPIHASNIPFPTHIVRDQSEDKVLSENGYTVIRIWEHEIKKNDFSKLDVLRRGDLNGREEQRV
jgi:DNA mismatch endonuclease (patch repair protein)